MALMRRSWDRTMRWLITGGCGFIGRNLVQALRTRSNAVIRVVDNLSAGTRDALAGVAPVAELDPRTLRADNCRLDGPVELVIGDVCDGDLAERAITGMDVVVHLAANTGVGPSVADPRFDCITNVIGTLNCLEACRRTAVRTFVFASSGAPVGECEPPIHEELPAHPVSPYGASKLAGEAYCSAYKRTFAIDTVALRFGNCYGPLSSHKSSVVANFIREAMAGRPWEIFGDGRQTRDFIFVDDVTDAIIRSATTPGIGGEIFQIATNVETTVLELATALSAALERNGIATAGIRHGEPLIGDVRRNYSDTGKAARMLGWKPKVGLENGLDRTVKWFLTQA
jgi:UDP-glucose 4-epimerase